MATATPTKFNSKSPTIRRILREAHELSTCPSADYHAVPLETDLFEWHFTLRGPPGSAFESGIYHGRIVLPPSYPLRPPSFRFLTPSGRFETNREICLSISGHHEETWQPAWGLRTALVALRTFMETDVRGQLGGLEAGEAVRRRLARESVAWRCGACCGGKTNGEILAECEERVRELAAKEGQGEGAGEGQGRRREAEVVVPPELKMGWRDEMEREAAAAAGGNGQEEEGRRQHGTADDGGGINNHDVDSDGESARLAEGFVQTAPPVAASAAASTSAIPFASGSSGGGGGSGGSGAGPAVVRRQAAVGSAAAPVGAGPALQQLERRVADDVPGWLDRLIVAVAILLAAVVVKVMLV